MTIRALASTALAATLLLGTAGCGIFVDSATLKPYSAGDGLNVNVGGLQLRNVLVITDESGIHDILGHIFRFNWNFWLIQFIAAFYHLQSVYIPTFLFFRKIFEQFLYIFFLGGQCKISSSADFNANISKNFCKRIHSFTIISIQ